MAEKNLEKLSRRDFFKIGGLVLISNASFNSEALTSNSYKIPKTDITLNEGSPLPTKEYLATIKRVNTCINIDDSHCSYREHGNCFRCMKLEYFETV